MSIELGLDRENLLDLLTLNVGFVEATGSGLDDWYYTYRTGTSVTYVDPFATVTYQFPDPFVFYRGHGVWIDGQGNVAERSGITLATSITQPIGFGQSVPVLDTTAETKTGTTSQTGQDVLETLAEPPQGGAPTSAFFNKEQNSVEAGILFAGGDCSYYFVTTESSRTTTSAGRQARPVSSTLQCPTGVQARDSFGRFPSQLLGGALGPAQRTSGGAAGFNEDIEIIRGQDTKYFLYNALSGTTIQDKQFAVVSSASTLAGNSVPVDIPIQGAKLSKFNYSLSRTVLNSSLSCQISLPDISSNDVPFAAPGTDPASHPDMPFLSTSPTGPDVTDPSQFPPLFNEWNARYVNAFLDVLTGGDTSYNVTTEFAENPEWAGFVGSPIAYVDVDPANPDMLLRFKGVITSVSPSQNPNPVVSTSLDFIPLAPKIPALDRPSQIISSVQVTFSESESIEFDWHFGQGIKLYSTGSIAAVPTGPFVLWQAQADGSFRIIASKTPESIPVGELGDNLAEIWTISLSGDVELGPIASYKYWGMGDEPVLQCKCWDIFNAV